MNKDDDQQPSMNNSDEIYIRDIVYKTKSGVNYLKSKWLTVLLVSVIGALIGLGYSIFKKTTYTAVCTFVLEETDKTGGLGQYAGLVSLAGINLGGSGNDGMFEGDNILELYKSRTMIEKAFLSEIDINGKKQLLIDRYIDTKGLRKKWKNEDNIDVSFTGDPEKFNRLQDSIITNLVEYFNKKVLTVVKPDKKLSIINVAVVANDELFAKEFANALVKNVNSFYSQTKTKKEYQNILVLQHQADSVRKVLNSSISGVASALDAAPNANPLLVSLKVPSQKRQIDVQASSAIYAEVVKNLEISKVSLRQQTPLIQVIDKPVLPLKNDKIKKVVGILTGLILGAFLSTCYLLFRRALIKI